MHRLLYISTARTILSKQEMDDILRISRRNNRAVGVTGLLIVGGRRFLQALEGEAEAVTVTYDRIRTDARHFATVVLANQPIASRQFGGWSMGYQPGGTLHDAAPVNAALEGLVAPIADPTLRAYFQNFAELHAAA